MKLDLLIQAGIALGTIGAVVVALFGQAFRAKFFPPVLTLRVLDTDGHKTKAWIVPPPESPIEMSMARPGREVNARYYHVAVTNDRRWSPGHQVQVVLLKLEEARPDGGFATTWIGDLPLNWRHREAFPSSRSVGPEAVADLCSIIEGKWLELETAVKPTNLNFRHREATDLVLTIQARSNEGDSYPTRVRISWDGRWSTDTLEMRQHLVLSVLENSPST